MSGVEEFFNRVLLPLQLTLGIWQIGKTTPLRALMHCSVSSLFTCFCFPCSTYNRLRKFPGRVFKKVICHVTTPGDMQTIYGRRMAEMTLTAQTPLEYLGKTFQLERKEGNLLLIDNVVKYFITDEMWDSVMYIAGVAPTTVFIKGCNEFWEEVVTGGVMSLEEVLDSVILDGHRVTRLDQDYFLPVNLSLSEEKLLKVFNLVGLFLHSQKHIHWLIPVSLTLTAAVLGVSTTLRVWVYGFIHILFCKAVHLLCERFPFSVRRQVYSLGNWVDKLKPSNDLQSKIVRGNICVLIAGGAKPQTLGATLVESELLSNRLTSIDRVFNQGNVEIKCSFRCGKFNIKCKFAQSNGKCSLEAGDIASVDVVCSREEAIKLFTFASCMAESRSGSLKSYDPKTKTVYVRRFRESVAAYVRSGYPPFYKLHLENVVVR
ncbi:hypothetical protein SUGI_0096750 [Cryptomeria japonica]|nr:hypothetical protein SUGI_0096750 [Cryptomeria japonica]